jgi:hypothetical protein
MKKLILCSILIGVFAASMLADWPSGGGYQLRWGAVTNGGSEGDVRMSSGGLRLSDNLGNSSFYTDSFLVGGAAYKNRPGFRKVDWDERHPFTSVNDLGADTISSAPNFPISWGGADTTTEDGIGWGVRFYDVQYRREAGTWQDWYIQTILTSAIFGPLAPETVYEDTIYYFRCRAYDLPGNVEPWPTSPDYQAWARYEQQVLEWVVVNQADSNDWTIEETLTYGYTATMQAGDLFIVKNNGSVEIDMGIKGYPTTGWTLRQSSGPDRYALRAHFDDNAVPPATFVIQDAVYDTGFTWASGRSTDPDTLLGPGGWGLQPAGSDSTSRTENLWLQLHVPTEASVWNPNQVIRLDLKAKTTTP